MMGYYVYSNYENCGAYECWLTRPNFIPRKVEHKNSFGDQLEGQRKPVEVGGIPAEQKEALRRKLNYGRGGMSLQEWDDFLADLEEMDVITHDERFYANGTFLEIPEAAQNGGTYASNGDPEAELDRLWTGNPLKWLENLDFTRLKYSLYANMGCRTAPALSSQRSAYLRVADVIRDILRDSP